MIDQPIHRSKRLLSADTVELARWSRWLLPALVMFEASFVGMTFDTLATTLFFVGFLFLFIGAIRLYKNTRTNGGQSRTDSGAPSRQGGTDLEQILEVATRRENDSSKAVSIKVARSLGLVTALSLVTVLAAALRVQHHIHGNLNPIAMIVDLVSHAMLFVTATLWAFYPRRGHPAMLGCGLVIAFLAVSAGGVSHSINGQLVAALVTVIAFTISSDYILSQWQIIRGAKQRQRAGKRRRRRNALLQSVSNTSINHQSLYREPLPNSTVSITTDKSQSTWLILVLVLSLFMMSTSAAGHLAGRVVPGLQLTFFDQLSQSLESVTSNSILGGSRYVRGSRLGQLRRHMLGDPSQIALRAFADSEPGHLRGYVFDTYQRGAWSSTSSHSRRQLRDVDSLKPRDASILMPAQTKTVGRTNIQMERISVRKNPENDILGTIEVHNVPEKGNVVFTSLSTEWIEAAQSGVRISHHDSILSGLNTFNPYVLGIGVNTPREKLDDRRREILVALPAPVRSGIQPIAEDVCAGRLTAPSKAKAIEDYFQANFLYSLRNPRSPKETDPVVHFLQSQHPAHCEFFATAAALMLRSLDVPTRYVTGYVVKEKSEDGQYWIARNRDAHAWVEAYDEISERWFPVEATVGRSYRTFMSNEQQLDDRATGGGGLNDLEDDRTIVGKLFGWLLSVRATDSLTVVFRIAQLPLFCAVVLLLWIRHRQKIRQASDPQELQSRQMLSQVDRRVRKHHLQRVPSETLHQFAIRVDAAAEQSTKEESATFLRRAADWYRHFASARYRGQMPNPI